MDNTKQAGFNLIELMVVVAIIGILAAIALPSYNRYVNKSRVVSAVVLTDPARIAVNEYALTHPGELGALSNTALNLSSEALVNGSDNVSSITIQGTSADSVTISAVLADNLGTLTWTGTFNATTDNLTWDCTYAASDRVAQFAPNGCHPAAS